MDNPNANANANANGSNIPWMPQYTTPYDPSLSFPAPPAAAATAASIEEQRVRLELARETIKLRELELQIAAEKRREREAELALAHLHGGGGGAQGSGSAGGAGGPSPTGHAQGSPHAARPLQPQHSGSQQQHQPYNTTFSAGGMPFPGPGSGGSGGEHQQPNFDFSNFPLDFLAAGMGNWGMPGGAPASNPSSNSAQQQQQQQQNELSLSVGGSAMNLSSLTMGLSDASFPLDVGVAVDDAAFDDILAELLQNEPSYVPPPPQAQPDTPVDELSPDDVAHSPDPLAGSGKGSPSASASASNDDSRAVNAAAGAMAPGGIPALGQIHNGAPASIFDQTKALVSRIAGVGAFDTGPAPRFSPTDGSASGTGTGSGSGSGSVGTSPETALVPSSASSVGSAGAGQAQQAAPTQLPTTKRSKKLLLEQLASCASCGAGIAKLLLRGTKPELDEAFDMHYLCASCAPAVPAQQGVRKRVKQTEDTTLPTVCDVCLRTRGRGGVVPRREGAVLQFAVEVVCLPCTDKYKRCSDCGGGSGRLGVGKWRCRELFDEGRKTCNLSHARLGTGELELAVWEVPDDVEQELQIETVLNACENLWRENVLRMAVPEILDSDAESPLGLKTFNDIQHKILQHGWPARDFVMRDETYSGQRKYLALTWAKNRPRRGKTTTIGERTGKVVKDDDWLFANIRRTRIFAPAGSMLVGIWLSHWDMNRRTIHISTSSPFDPGDLEDRSVVAIAETLNRIITTGSNDAAAILPPAHVWVTYNELSPVIEQRMEDALIKKKGFFPLDEYVQRFPDVKRDDFIEPKYTRVVKATGWKQGDPGLDTPVHILVKTLGKSMNWYRLQKLKMQEVSAPVAPCQPRLLKCFPPPPAALATPRCTRSAS
ncbi:hypothetical protein CALCODRAFT_78813 [Calocera cornea HHB12733]|uniref:Uncharacterized protein n=1 Tax=Calocera cornea HHB12733 TaxID=1353952 RepID=A0A165DG69_9BASI|nr:hypothetical protein CALCODRAFT_78813 [Calocera cornea HHB12733]